MLRRLLLAFLSVGLLGCASDRINAEARRERQNYLLKSCVEKGGFPDVDAFGEFKSCKWPEPRGGK